MPELGDYTMRFQHLKRAAMLYDVGQGLKTFFADEEIVDAFGKPFE